MDSIGEISPILLIDVHYFKTVIRRRDTSAWLHLARACAELHVHNPPDLVRALVGQTFSSWLLKWQLVKLFRIFGASSYRQMHVTYCIGICLGF